MSSYTAAKRAIGRIAVIVLVVVIIAIIGVAAYALTITSTPTVSNTSTNTTTPVNFELDFAPNSYHALWYYSLDQGIYTQNHLEVNIVPGTSPANTVSAVAAGTANFGIASLVSVIAAEAHGVTNVKVIGVVYHSNPDTVFYIQGRGITSLKDLAGKTFGTFAGSAAAQELPLVLQGNGINYSSVKISIASPATLPSLLISGKVDFIALTANRISDIGAAAQQNNLQLGDFFYKNYGFNRYDLVMITNTNMIQNHTSVVQQFVNASYYGQWLAMQNPALATQSILKYVPSLNSTITLQGLNIAINESVNPIPTQSSSNPLYMGWINSTQMVQSVNLISRAFNITSAIQVPTIYTNQFVVQPPS